MVMAVAAALARAADVAPTAALRDPAKWIPVEGSPAAVAGHPDDTKPVLALPCPFAKLSGWRAAWDLEGPLDLAAERWIRVRVRTDDPEAVAGITLYFESGKGWYTAGFGGPSKGWRTLSVPRANFNTEGKPGSWSSIHRMRIGVMPGAKRDTVVQLAGVEATSAVGVDDVLAVGPWQGRAELKAAFATSTPLVAAWNAAAVEIDQAARAPDLNAPGPQALLDGARRILVEAYARAQSPRRGELRGVWCHDGTAYGMGWDAACEALAANGFNAVFPNLLWSGIAYYPSKILPVAKVVAEKGDQLQALLDAAHKRGIAVHLWKVCWQMGWMSDPAAAVPFRFANRMQVDRDGKQGEWLCPSDARNRTYELDAIREVVAKYPIDGFHLDYIRYGGDEWCFCRTCQANFEEGLGRHLKDWPRTVVAGGANAAAYADWRRNVITSFVREVKRMIQDVRPEVRLSAAVFPVPSNARQTVLQDWGRWIQDGLVDFVCPMNYTENLEEMQARLRAELDAAGGKAPVCAGLFATYGEGRDQRPDMAIAQIVAARAMGAGGFVLFELEPRVVRDLLPLLHLGVTRP